MIHTLKERKWHPEVLSEKRFWLFIQPLIRPETAGIFLIVTSSWIWFEFKMKPKCLHLPFAAVVFILPLSCNVSFTSFQVKFTCLADFKFIDCVWMLLCSLSVDVFIRTLIICKLSELFSCSTYYFIIIFYDFYFVFSFFNTIFD